MDLIVPYDVAMNRRLFFAALGLFFSQGSCRSQETKSYLRLGINDWIGYAIARYGKAAGIFAQRGLEVDFIEFVNLQDATRAMMRGSLDASFSTLWDLLQTEHSTDAPVVFLVTNISRGSDGIVARPPWQSLQELKGKTIGAKLGTVNHLILLEALRLHNMSPEAIEIKDISNEIAAQEVRAGKIAAAVLWQPLLEETARAMQGKIIYTTRDTNSLVIDILATRADTLKRKKLALRQFCLAWFDIMAILEKNPTSIFTYLAQELQQSTASVKESYGGVEPGTMALNQKMFGTANLLAQALEDMKDLLRQDSRYGRESFTPVAIEVNLINDVLEQWKQNRLSRP